MAPQSQGGAQQRPQQHGPQDDGPGDDAAPGAAGGAQSQQRAEELDGLLDEIDSVLETNAEEFVRGFVQKGGQ